MPEDKKPISWLRDNIDKANIAEGLPEEVLSHLGDDVVYGYGLDKSSRSEWEELTNRGLGIAMQKFEPKTFPWPDCSNVKHPLIATAAIQFASRSYPEIVKGSDVVKAAVIGEDPEGIKEKRAKRVSQHMSWQLTEEMSEWEEDTDKLLHSLPVVGICYRKTYRDVVLGRNKSELRSAMNVVVNHNAKDLDTCRRITDEVWLYKNDVIERERFGLFLDDISGQMKGDEKEKPQELFLEQHCYADLDGDGYEEPYIVTVHHDSGKVARIVARYDEDGIKTSGVRSGEIQCIVPVQYFTKYSFIPSPDGKYHDLGFAQLLGPMNETMNTLLNQLLDAGTLHNLQGGFVGKGVKWQGGVMRFIPGEWKPVDVSSGVLKDNVVPLPTREPSSVLFQLLGWLNDAAMRLASVSETMTGETPGANVPATTVLAMIEQGLKVFTSIYKRVFRSLKSEYKKLYRLNRLYLDEKEYYRVLDAQSAVYRDDYNGSDLDVIPVADPTISSEAQRLARARATYETMERNPSKKGRLEILRRYYEALNVPQIDKILPPDEIKQITEGQGPPDPALLKLEADTLKQKHDYELAMRRTDLDEMKMEADVQLTKALAIKAIAEAEAKEVGQQFELYQHEVAQLSQEVKLAIEIMKEKNRARQAEGSGPAESGDRPEPDSGSPGGMEAVPNDQGSVPVSPGGEGGIPGADVLGPDGQPVVSGADGTGDVPPVGSDLRG